MREDSRERILLVKNRIGLARAEYLKKERKPQQKDIIFQIRTVDKKSEGINADAGWLSVQLENIPRLEDYENAGYLMNSLENVLEPNLIKILFSESLAKAMSKLTFPL